MEFPFDIQSVFKGSSGIYIITKTLSPVSLDDWSPLTSIKFCSQNEATCNGRQPMPVTCVNPITHSAFGSPVLNKSSSIQISNQDFLTQIIDRVGEASALAQSLNAPVTTTQKLLSSDHAVYVVKDSESIVGILKVGRKKLFIIDERGKLHEDNPLCVLDFYVHESRQRMGFGKELFEALLKVENIEPHNLAIDKPSSKFLGFLKKHYNMVQTIPQANNFVIFSGFFDNHSHTPQTPSPLPNQRHSFAGVEHRALSHNGRPHSLGGVEGCFSWNGSPNSPADSDFGGSTREIRTAKRMSNDRQKRNSSSYNVFGVP